MAGVFHGKRQLLVFPVIQVKAGNGCLLICRKGEIHQFPGSVGKDDVTALIPGVHMEDLLLVHAVGDGVVSGKRQKILPGRLRLRFGRYDLVHVGIRHRLRDLIRTGGKGRDQVCQQDRG